MWILLLALVLDIYLKPYYDPQVAKLELMSICTLLLSLSIATLFLWDLPAWLAIVVTVALFISILVPLYVLLVNICQQVIFKLVSFSLVCASRTPHPGIRGGPKGG